MRKIKAAGRTILVQRIPRNDPPPVEAIKTPPRPTKKRAAEENIPPVVKVPLRKSTRRR